MIIPTATLMPIENHIWFVQHLGTRYSCQPYGVKCMFLSAAGFRVNPRGRFIDIQNKGCRGIIPRFDLRRPKNLEIASFIEHKQIP